MMLRGLVLKFRLLFARMPNIVVYTVNNLFVHKHKQSNKM